ncbi:MAG: type III PLP-dependent enzyme, partial [Nocardiaceae bacterium]|nr:type III PLP-dependent enzyme [Nocardiaceae bacterium]
TTPCVVIDLDTVAARLEEFHREFLGFRICYAVKANPARSIVKTIVDGGGQFDVASVAEIDLCLAEGADPRTISFGNPIKKAKDIAYAYSKGVREFVTDSIEDIDTIAAYAPGSEVSVRMLVAAPDSGTPFGRKFGVNKRVAAELLLHAADCGLEPMGVSFHVGSQQMETSAYIAGIKDARWVFDTLAKDGYELTRLNLGGGFAVTYDRPAPPISTYAKVIHRAIAENFPNGVAELLLEPGRAIVGESGILRTEVVLVARRPDGRRWVYLDVGRYNGMAETENEYIAYKLEIVGGARTQDSSVVIAGPTCDGDDVLYQKTPYKLPLDLKAGDRIDIINTGAYTSSYSSVAFNGIEPLRTICISGDRVVEDN